MASMVNEVVCLDNKRVLLILVSLAQQIYTCFLSLSFKSWDLTLCFNNRSYLFRDKSVTVGGALWVGFFSQQCRHFPTSMTSQSFPWPVLWGRTHASPSTSSTFQLNLQGRSGNYRCPCYHGYEVPCLQGGSSRKGEEMFAFVVIFLRIFVHSQSGGHLEGDAKKKGLRGH